jgi:hypothetical protein
MEDGISTQQTVINVTFEVLSVLSSFFILCLRKLKFDIEINEHQGDCASYMKLLEHYVDTYYLIVWKGIIKIA